MLLLQLHIPTLLIQIQQNAEEILDISLMLFLPIFGLVAIITPENLLNSIIKVMGNQFLMVLVAKKHNLRQHS